MAASVSAVAKESSAARAGELWATSGLTWTQFLEDGADTDKFVKDKVRFHMGKFWAGDVQIPIFQR